ncbi:hypothetical protein OBBRIDRAFT_691512, partial [Obba rivulosa]
MPPELNDMVIDYLHDDFDSLKNCSLTCRAWLPACRMHLFRRMTCKKSPLHAITKFIHCSPHLGPYVKELRV